MGQYKDGKWEPTWGDDQFGVVDSPAEMYNRNRKLEAEVNRLREALKAVDAWARKYAPDYAEAMSSEEFSKALEDK